MSSRLNEDLVHTLMANIAHKPLHFGEGFGSEQSELYPWATEPHLEDQRATSYLSDTAGNEMKWNVEDVNYKNTTDSVTMWQSVR